MLSGISGTLNKEKVLFIAALVILILGVVYVFFNYEGRKKIEPPEVPPTKFQPAPIARIEFPPRGEIEVFNPNPFFSASGRIPIPAPVLATPPGRVLEVEPAPVFPNVNIKNYAALLEQDVRIGPSIVDMVKAKREEMLAAENGEDAGEDESEDENGGDGADEDEEELDDLSDEDDELGGAELAIGRHEFDYDHFGEPIEDQKWDRLVEIISGKIKVEGDYDELRTTDTGASIYFYPLDKNGEISPVSKSYLRSQYRLEMRESAVEQYAELDAEAATSVASRWDEHFKLAKRCMRSFDPDDPAAPEGGRDWWDLAIEQLNKAVALQPSESPLYWYLGYLYNTRKRDANAAVSALVKGINAGAATARLYIYLGTMCLENYQKDLIYNAIKMFNQALLSEPDNLMAREKLLAAYISLEDMENARAQLDGIGNLESDSYAMHSGTARIALYNADLDTAEAEYKLALEIIDGAIDELKTEKLGLNEEAQRLATNKLLEMTKTKADVVNALGAVYFWRGDLGNAWENFRSSADLGTAGHRALFNLGFLYNICGDRDSDSDTDTWADAAAEVWAELELAYPFGNGLMEFGKAMTALLNDDDEAAREAFEAIQEDLKNDLTLQQLVLLKLSRGVYCLETGLADDTGASEDTDTPEDDGSGNGDRPGEETPGGQTLTKSEGYFKEIIKLDPDFMGSYIWLSKLYTDTDRGNLAEKIWRKMLKTGTGNADLRFYLGHMLLVEMQAGWSTMDETRRADEFRRVKSEFEAALAADPESGITLAALGYLHFTLDPGAGERVERSLQYFTQAAAADNAASDVIDYANRCIDAIEKYQKREQEVDDFNRKDGPPKGGWVTQGIEGVAPRIAQEKLHVSGTFNADAEMSLTNTLLKGSFMQSFISLGATFEIGSTGNKNTKARIGIASVFKRGSANYEIRLVREPDGSVKGYMSEDKKEDAITVMDGGFTSGRLEIELDSENKTLIRFKAVPYGPDGGEGVPVVSEWIEEKKIRDFKKLTQKLFVSGSRGAAVDFTVDDLVVIYEKEE